LRVARKRFIDCMLAGNRCIACALAGNRFIDCMLAGNRCIACALAGNRFIDLARSRATDSSTCTLARLIVRDRARWQCRSAERVSLTSHW
jgi:hypothetical protein